MTPGRRARWTPRRRRPSRHHGQRRPIVDRDRHRRRRRRPRAHPGHPALAAARGRRQQPCACCARAGRRRRRAAVGGAGRLYPGRVVQLEGAAGAELLTRRHRGRRLQVTLSAHADRTLPSRATRSPSSRPSVTVRYRPPGGDEETERFSGLRLTDDDRPRLAAPQGRAPRSRLVRADGRRRLRRHGPRRRSPPSRAAPGRRSASGDDALGRSRRRPTSSARTSAPASAPASRRSRRSTRSRSAWCRACGRRTSAVRADRALRDARRPVRDPRPAAAASASRRSRRSAARSTPSTPRSTTRGCRSATRGPGGDDEHGARRRASSPAIYARTDVARGVHKAPANEVMRSIRGFAQAITKREQDILNPQNINVAAGLPGPRQPGLGRARADLRRGVEVRPRPAAVPHDRGVDRRGHAVGRLRAQRRAAVGAGAPVGRPAS